MAVTYTSDMNPPTDSVDAIDEFEANGATMAGMTVRATFFNNDTFEEFVETVTWVATGATSGGVVGTNWSLSVSSDTYTGSWSFTINFVSGIGQLTELYFDGAPGGVIFDRTFGSSDGTVGSELGRDFAVVSGASGGDIHVTYSVPVSIGAAEPVGDLFRRMTVAFEVDGLGPTGPATDWVFRQDTDQQLDLPPDPDPTPPAGQALHVTRGWGVNRHILTVRMVQTAAATPLTMGLVGIRNGYDGDVGVSGYLSESVPFEVLSSLDQDAALLTAEGVQEFGVANLGGGSATDAAPYIGPIAVAETRVSTESADATEAMLYSVDAFIPLRATDRLWVVDATFEGSGLAWSVTLVAGPTAASGRRFMISTGDVSPARQSWTMTRLSDL